jgi:acetyl-CoA acetyltransferase
MREVVILDAVRTPIGKVRGALSAVRPDDLLATVFAALVSRNQLDAKDIDEVMAGCANQAGEDNRNVARMASLLAGFPYEVPAFTVNRLCASGLTAVVQAWRAIRVGDAELCIAGGVESMSRAPWALGKPDTALEGGNRTAYDTALGWRFPNPRLAARFPLEAMGETPRTWWRAIR